jgi:hypothetical protein
MKEVNGLLSNAEAVLLRRFDLREEKDSLNKTAKEMAGKEDTKIPSHTVTK